MTNNIRWHEVPRGLDLEARVNLYGNDLGSYDASRGSHLWDSSSGLQPSNVYKPRLDHATLAVN